MSQSKSRLDIPWPNDTDHMGLCPVPFVMRIPIILWCRVPSLPRWWLGVHIRPMYCTLLPGTKEWKWAGLNWPDAQAIQVRGTASSPLIPHFSFVLWYFTDTILGNPTPEVVEKCVPVGSSSRRPEHGLVGSVSQEEAAPLGWGSRGYLNDSWCWSWPVCS